MKKRGDGRVEQNEVKLILLRAGDRYSLCVSVCFTGCVNQQENEAKMT